MYMYSPLAMMQCRANMMTVGMQNVKANFVVSMLHSPYVKRIVCSIVNR
jgi:hypothetical protein